MKAKNIPAERSIRLPVAAIAFIAALVFAVGGYAAIVYSNARSGADWVLIVPIALLTIIALLFAIREDVKTFAQNLQDGKQSKTSSAGPALLFMATLVGYVLLIPYIGIEISTMGFLAVALLIQGERRYTVLAGISIIGGGALVWCFVRLFSVSMPTVFL